MQVFRVAEKHTKALFEACARVRTAKVAFQKARTALDQAESDLLKTEYDVISSMKLRMDCPFAHDYEYVVSAELDDKRAQARNEAARKSREAQCPNPAE